jgi:hypothetical protein
MFLACFLYLLKKVLLIDDIEKDLENAAFPMWGLHGIVYRSARALPENTISNASAIFQHILHPVKVFAWSYFGTETGQVCW